MTGNRIFMEKALETAPSSFYLYDFDGNPKVHYGGDDVHYDPGSAAIEIADYGANESRVPATADCENYVRLAEMLPDSYRGVYADLVSGAGATPARPDINCRESAWT